MAIDIKAPLADRLYALGSMVGDEGTPQFKGRNKGSSYRGSAPVMQSQGESGGGALSAIGAIGGSLLNGWLNSETPAATDASGNGFGLGGNLSSGDVGNAQYAGMRRPGIFEYMGGQGEEQNAGQNGLFNGFTYGGRP